MRKIPPLITVFKRRSLFDLRPKPNLLSQKVPGVRPKTRVLPKTKYSAEVITFCRMYNLLPNISRITEGFLIRHDLSLVSIILILFKFKIYILFLIAARVFLSSHRSKGFWPMEIKPRALFYDGWRSQKCVWEPYRLTSKFHYTFGLAKQNFSVNFGR